MKQKLDRRALVTYPTAEERELLQKIADEFGFSLSDVARCMISHGLRTLRKECEEARNKT